MGTIINQIWMDKGVYIMIIELDNNESNIVIEALEDYLVNNNSLNAKLIYDIIDKIEVV